jgi:hypothetical protein
MANIIALAVQDMHSSCSETADRAFSRVRPVIPAVLSASFKGTTVPSTDLAGMAGNAPYGVVQTDGTTKARPSGFLTWSPPV